MKKLSFPGAVVTLGGLGAMCWLMRWSAVAENLATPRAGAQATAGWVKYEGNPVFKSDPGVEWEKHKVTACQVLRQGGSHVMFYIGFRDTDHAQIGIARSKDGVTGWQRHPANPVIRPGQGQWDHDACYKPFALFNGEKWRLWYNGRRGSVEQIGVAFHEGEDLGFESSRMR